MTDLAEMIDLPRAARPALLAAGLLAAACALAAPSPAQALDTGWRKACTFPTAPQAYNEMMRERVCIMANDCQIRADAQGAPYTGAGCFMVRPSPAARTPLHGR